MEVSQLFQCNWAHPSTSTTWHTSANQSCHPSCIASLVLLTRSAFTQEVKHSQHCSWVLEAFQPEPRWVCYRLCCSRHVLQMETDSLTGLSLRSEHFRAFFFSWLLLTVFWDLPVIFFKVTYGNDLRTAAQSKLVLQWGPFHTAVCPVDVWQDQRRVPCTIFQGPGGCYPTAPDMAGSSGVSCQMAWILIIIIPCSVLLWPK